MRATHKPERGIYAFPATIEAEARTAPSKQDTIQTIVQMSPNFQVTSNMLQMDETIAQTPLKDLVQVELVMKEYQLRHCTSFKSVSLRRCSRAQEKTQQIAAYEEWTRNP
jgi:hypothetical protein